MLIDQPSTFTGPCSYSRIGRRNPCSNPVVTVVIDGGNKVGRELCEFHALLFWIQQSRKVTLCP